MRLSKKDILSIPHQETIGFDEVKDFIITGISTDTRSIKSKEMFVAIKGNQFDGHNFISKAIEADASCIVVERKWTETNTAMMVSILIPRLIVENTTYALGHFARLIRMRHKMPFIAVGGSNGKTTTKEMIGSVLSKKYNVLQTEGNLNNHIGVPQTLFRLNKKHKMAVVEIGTNHPGEIEYLCSVLLPTHGLITNIGSEHLEFFGSAEGVAKAECELFDWLKENEGTAFINVDDKFIKRLSRRSGKKILYGLTGKNISVKGKISSYDMNAQATLNIKPEGKKSFDIIVGASGKHNAQNALAAAAVGLAMKVPSVQIRKALNSFKPAKMRMQIRRIGNITILNDTYNSNPDSTLAALATMELMKLPGKKIAILSDMLELGNHAEELHRKIGESMSRYNVDMLLTFGALSKFTHDSAGIEKKDHFEEKELLVNHLFGNLSAGDVILVKGSRGMKMDEVVSKIEEGLSQRSGL